MTDSTDLAHHLDVRPLSGVLGAEIFGIDLSQPLDDASIAGVRRAFLDDHVLVFRDQHLEPQQQVAFGRYFGELDTHPFVEMNAEHPELLDVITLPDDRANFGGG